jgi:aminoglycoside 6'-N-acetyltransferase
MQKIAFLPLRRSDFPLLSQWLKTPHVVRWWNDDADLAAIEADYGGVVDGTEPAEAFIAYQGATPIGLIQRYRMDAYQGYIAELEHILSIPHDTFSIDYLIGPPAMLGKGLGTAMIVQFVNATWQIATAPNCIIVPVQAGNLASCRVLERSGFVPVSRGDMTPDNPADDREHVIYRLDKSTGETT